MNINLANCQVLQDKSTESGALNLLPNRKPYRMNKNQDYFETSLKEVATNMKMYDISK